MEITLDPLVPSSPKHTEGRNRVVPFPAVTSAQSRWDAAAMDEASSSEDSLDQAGAAHRTEQALLSALLVQPHIVVQPQRGFGDGPTAGALWDLLDAAQHRLYNL